MRTPNFYFAVCYKQEDLTRTAVPFSTLFKGILVFINFLLRVFITFSAHTTVIHKILLGSYQYLSVPYYPFIVYTLIYYIYINMFKSNILFTSSEI